MANGQPRPAFYVAALLVVAGLVALGLWRMGKIGPGSQLAQITNEELKQMKGGPEAADTSGITTVKEYKYVAATRLPPPPRSRRRRVERRTSRRAMRRRSPSR